MRRQRCLFLIAVAFIVTSNSSQKLFSFAFVSSFVTSVAQQGQQRHTAEKCCLGNSLFCRTRDCRLREGAAGANLAKQHSNEKSFVGAEEHSDQQNDDTTTDALPNERSTGLLNNQPKPHKLNSELLNLRRRSRGGDFRRNNSAQLAEERLEQAMQLQMDLGPSKTRKSCAESDDNTMFPNEKSFNIVIMAYAEQSDKGNWLAPTRAEQLLQKMKKFPHVQPSVFTYNAVMEAWVKSSSENGGPLQRLQRQQDYRRQRQQSKAKRSVLALFEEMKLQGLQPDVYSFNLVLSAYARSSDPNDTVHAENWLEKMNIDDEINSNRQTYSIILTAYANHGKMEKAYSLLQTLIQQHANKELKSDDSLKPTQFWFNCAFKACATYSASSSGRLDPSDCRRNNTVASSTAGETADRLLLQMMTLYQNGLSSLRPDAYVYNHVLNVHAQNGNTERVEVLLEELEQHYAKTRDPAMAPDRFSYTTVIKAYANSGSESSHLRAETLFRKMQNLAVSSDNRTRSIAPNIVTYNTMIKIWASLRTRQGLQRAADILRQMEQQQYSNPGKIIKPPPPNAMSYTELIHGWAKSGLRDAGYRAEKLLLELEQVPPNRKRNLNWTTIYNSVITAWAKSGDEVAPQRVESLLGMLERKCFSSSQHNHITSCPSKTTFLCIADTYAKAGIMDAEQRCDDLLERMKRLQKGITAGLDYPPQNMPNLKPDRALYNSILNALAKSCQPSAGKKSKEILTMMQTSPDPGLRPDIVTYSTFIDCSTKSSGGDVCQAEELLRFVEGSYRNGDKLLKPNAVFYSAILQAWAKTATQAGAEKAEQLLRRNEGLYEKGYDYAKPHGLMYNAVMDAVARTGLPGAGRRAAELLTEMESHYKNGDEEMKPTRRSFNAVMLAYRHDESAAEKAEKLLDRMESLADDNSDDQLKPDVVTYNCVLHAILSERSEQQQDVTEASNRAQSLLDRMKERGVQPDGITYSCVIEAWLKRHDQKGSQMAEKLLQNFLKLVDDSSLTQGNADQNLDPEVVLDVINSYRDKQIEL